MIHPYGLVEPMQYVFIRIQKARGLAPNESPYLKIRTSNQQVKSNPASYRPGQPNDSPEWHRVFALSYNKPDSASPTVEISVWDFPSENFLGAVCFDLSDVPVRDPPDSPLAPQWYRLEAGAYQHSGRITGDLQLSVWIGTQADEAFPEAKLTSSKVSVRGSSSSMDNVNGVPGDAGYSGYHYVEELVPSAGWTEDSNCHCLQIRFPGFKKEQFRLEVASTGNLILSGERMVNESKAVYIDKTYKLPEDSDVENITVKYDGLFLYITVPKLARQEEKGDEKEQIENVSSIIPGNNAQEPARNSENLGRHDDGGHHCGQHNNNEKKVDQSKKTGRVDSFSKEFITQLEAGSRGRAMDLLGIGFVLVVAFSLGVLVSQMSKSKANSQG